MSSQKVTANGRKKQENAWSNSLWFLEPVPIIVDTILNDIREEIWSLVPTNARLQKLMFPSVQVSLWTCDEVEDVLFSDFFGVGGGVEGGDGCGGCGAREEEKAEG